MRSSTATAAAIYVARVRPVLHRQTRAHQRRAHRCLLGQRRRRVVLRRAEERDVLPTAPAHPSPSTLRCRRLHRGLLQPPPTALHPRLSHPVRSTHRPPPCSSRCLINKLRNCPKSLTQPKLTKSFSSAAETAKQYPQYSKQIIAGAKSSFLDGADWAYTAGLIAVLLGALIVFFLFPKKNDEQRLLAAYHAEDTGGSPQPVREPIIPSH